MPEVALGAVYRSMHRNKEERVIGRLMLLLGFVPLVYSRIVHAEAMRFGSGLDNTSSDRAFCLDGSGRCTGCYVGENLSMRTVQY